MQRMRALIVDDEPMSRYEMRRLLEAHPEIDVIGEADCGHAALKLLPTLKPDVIFLDIQMPEMNGFEFFNAIGNSPPRIIFSTAYDSHALRAFEVNAVDYLLKPIEPLRLAMAVQRLLETGVTDVETQGEAPLCETDHVLLKGEQRTWFVPVRSIYLLQSEGNYTQVFFKGGKALLPRTLASLELRLKLPIFFRANRAQLINTLFISEATDWFSGCIRVTLTSGDIIDMSRRQSLVFRKQKGL